MLKLAVVGLGDYGASVAAMLGSLPLRGDIKFGRENAWVRTRSVIRELEQHEKVGTIGNIQLDFVALTSSMMYQFFHGDSTEMSRQLFERVRAAAEKDTSILDWFPDPLPYVGLHPSGFWQHTCPAIMRGMLLAFPEVFQERLSALDHDVHQICLISTSFGRTGSAWIQDVVRICKENRPRATIKVLLFIPQVSDGNERSYFLNAVPHVYLRSLYTLKEIASVGVLDSEVFFDEINDCHGVSFDQINALRKTALNVASRQFISDERYGQSFDPRQKLIERGESEEKTLGPLQTRYRDSYRTMPSASYSG